VGACMGCRVEAGRPGVRMGDVGGVGGRGGESLNMVAEWLPVSTFHGGPFGIGQHSVAMSVAMERQPPFPLASAGRGYCVDLKKPRGLPQYETYAASRSRN
jgi:hypothetical protein